MMSYLPADDKARKGLPLFKQITRYFPKALREITKVSVVNNVRYNPDREPTDINWNRPLSADQLGSLFRHLLEHEVDGKVFDDVKPEVAEKTGITRIYVLAEAAWRALAALELEIEHQEAPALQEKEAVEWCEDCKSNHTKSFGDTYHGRLIKPVDEPSWPGSDRS